MATDTDQKPDPSDRFRWGGTSDIVMLDAQGNPLTPDEVALVNRYLVRKAEDEARAAQPAGKL